MGVIMKFLLLALIALSALPAKANIYQDLESLFLGADTSNATVTVSNDQVWAGRCVTHSRPNKMVAALMDVYLTGRPNDPLFPVEIYATHKTYRNLDPDFFLDADLDTLLSYHAQHRGGLLEEWDPLDFGDLSFASTTHRTYDRGGYIKTAVRYELRVVTPPRQDYYFVSRALCATEGCWEEPQQYCYFWDAKLAD